MTTLLPPDAFDIEPIAEAVHDLIQQRDAARRRADAYLRILTHDYPLVALAARWPGYATAFGLGVVAGMLLFDAWGVR